MANLTQKTVTEKQTKVFRTFHGLQAETIRTELEKKLIYLTLKIKNYIMTTIEQKLQIENTVSQKKYQEVNNVFFENENDNLNISSLLSFTWDYSLLEDEKCKQLEKLLKEVEETIYSRLNNYEKTLFKQDRRERPCAPLLLINSDDNVLTIK